MDNNLAYKSKSIEDVLIADTFFKRLKGYMFQKKPSHKAILIMPCNSIHTFFMNFDIAVLFLDENFQVVKKIEALKPRRIIMPVEEAAIVLEGEAGLFHDIMIGDKIIL
jgi:uncharacterized membrane protein (UPF0127 family)